MLAPRYNRAIAALLWDTAVGVTRTVTGQPLTLRTKLARDGMMKAVAGLSALNVALTTAHYIMNTDEDKLSMDDWGREIYDHMVPTSGKFFTWDILGRNLGPGTKVRSVLQLIAKSFIDPTDLAKGITMENPMVRFLRGSSAPVIGRGVDILSGYNYVGEPVRDEIGDLGGWAQAVPKVVLPNLVPIWAQALLFEGGSAQERLVGAGTEFFGGRGSPLTRTQEKQRYHQQDPEWRDTAWEELPISTLRQYDKRLTVETGDPGHTGPKRKLLKQVDDADAAHIERVADIAQMYLRDDPLSPEHSPRHARELLAASKAKRNEILNGPGGLYQQLYGRDELEEPDKDSLSHVRWEYYKMYDDASTDGEIDWADFEPREQEFWASLSEQESDWLLGSIHLIENEYHPQVKQLADATRWVSKLKVEVDGVDINYWNINRHPNVLAKLSEMVPSLEVGQIEEYLSEPQERREDLEERHAAYNTLARAKRILESSSGLINEYKDEFIQNAPAGWLNTMIMYGFDFKGRERAMREYRRQQERRGPKGFQEAFYTPPYREQYGAMMKATRSPEVLPGVGGVRIPSGFGAR